MEKPTDGQEPAFPFQCQGPTTGPEIYYGMTLRDWFAGQALTGYLAAMAGEDVIMPTPEKCARLSFAYADAMLKERGKVFEQPNS